MVDDLFNKRGLAQVIKLGLLLPQEQGWVGFGAGCLPGAGGSRPVCASRWEEGQQEPSVLSV